MLLCHIKLWGLFCPGSSSSQNSPVSVIIILFRRVWLIKSRQIIALFSISRQPLVIFVKPLIYDIYAFMQGVKIPSFFTFLERHFWTGAINNVKYMCVKVFINKCLWWRYNSNHHIICVYSGWLHRLRMLCFILHNQDV